MPKAKRRTKYIISFLQKHQQLHKDIHYENMERIGNLLAVGGSHMDTFFRLEGLTGIIDQLSKGTSLIKSLEYGKERARQAVLKWNSKREYQVHRWEETASAYLESKIKVALMRYENERELNASQNTR